MIIRNIGELEKSPPADVYLVYEIGHKNSKRVQEVCWTKGEVVALFTHSPNTYVKAYRGVE